MGDDGTGITERKGWGRSRNLRLWTGVPREDRELVEQVDNRDRMGSLNICERRGHATWGHFRQNHLYLSMILPKGHCLGCAPFLVLSSCLPSVPLESTWKQWMKNEGREEATIRNKLFRDKDEREDFVIFIRWNLPNTEYNCSIRLGCANEILSGSYSNSFVSVSSLFLLDGPSAYYSNFSWHFTHWSFKMIRCIFGTDSSWSLVVLPFSW